MMKTDNAIKPGLFGQKHSSRDYSDQKVWGKNQFNSSFPASLVAYMSNCGLDSVYLCYNGNPGMLIHKKINASELLGIDPLSEKAFYNFEAGYFPFEQFYNGNREKIDLVMVDLSTSLPLRGLEIKLTATPDDSTRHLDSEYYSSEIVVRPPTICFLACSICLHYNSLEGRARLKKMLDSVPQINHWDEISEVAPHFQKIQNAIISVCDDMIDYQLPLMIQPIWRTDESRSRLAEDCLDVFVWSNISTIQMCYTSNYDSDKGINRLNRTIIWLYKMLFDFCIYGQFDYTRIIKHHSYNAANDKAFSISGRRSYLMLKSTELRHPRIKKSEIKNIILGGGQNLLSPERRFDAVIVNTPGLFD